jgi:hypothetical protein
VREPILRQARVDGPFCGARRTLRRTYGSAFLLAVALVLSAAGQSVSGGSWNLHGASGPAAQGSAMPTLMSIAVMPAAPSQLAGSAVSVSATGTYSDGSSQDVTTAALWSSGNSAVATLGALSTTQAFSCVVAGTSVIRAAVGAVSGSATLTCNAAPTLVSIAVTPPTATQLNGSATAFTALGKYSDASSQDVTRSSIWSSSNVAVATLGALASSQAVNCVASGTSTVQATFGAISGAAALNCTALPASGSNAYCTPSGTWIGPATDGPASLPTICYYTAVSGTPSPGTVRGPVSTVTAFNSAYSAAACGDTIQIAAGASLTGPVTLTGKGCDDQHYITIKSAGVANASFPAEGTRATPCMSNVASLPNRPAYPCAAPQALTAQFVATSSNSAMVLNGADHIRFVGIEFTRVSTPGALIYSLVDLTAGGATQTNHIVFDRVWMHGINQDGNFPQTAASDTSTTRAVYLAQSNHVAVIDSYISDIYDNGSTASNGNTDAQCVGGGAGSVTNSGWGVYKFVNNHCEGASEGLILGGSGGPALTPAGCTFGVDCNLDVPTNIEVRQNHFFAPNSWNGNTTTINATGWPNRKNGIEFKTGANILLEANVFENCWYSSQPYCYVFDFAPKNQSNRPATPVVGTCLSCLVQDFVARYNYGYNYPGPQMALYSTMDLGCTNCTTLGRRGSIHDNLVGDKMNRGQLSQTGFDCTEFMAAAGPITNVSVRHNTCVNAFRSGYFLGASATGQLDQIVIQDNVMALGQFGTIAATGSGCDSAGANLFTIFNNCVNGSASTWTFDHNANFNWDTSNSGSTLGRGFPANGSGAGNWFYVGSAGPQFTNYGTGDSAFNPANYQVSSTSPLHNAASDGKDVGADIATLLQKIAGVRQ